MAWWLLACAAPASSPPADTGPAATPDTGAPSPVLELDVEAASARVEGLLATAFPSPVEIRAWYAALVEAGDASCPGDGDLALENGSVPLDGCTSTTGYRYLGLSEYEETVTESAVAFEMSMADLYITDPDGVTLFAAGTFAYDATADAWSGEATGSFGYAPAGGWLGAGASVAYAFTGDPDGFTITGGVATLDGEGDLFFDAFAACDGGATGGLWTRDPTGYWIRFEYGDACSACATVTLGAAPETACPALPLDGVAAALAMP